MNRFKNISSRILSYDNKENAGEAIIRERMLQEFPALKNKNLHTQQAQ